MSLGVWVLLVCTGVAMADQSAVSSYGAPTGPSSYAAPATGYETGGSSYDYSGYPAPDDGFDIGAKLEELLPLFVAVLAAIILAQILAPVLGSILALIVAILPGALTPKAIIINLILSVFNLQLCTTATPPVAFPAARSLAREFSGYASSYGLNLSDDQTTILSDFFTDALDSLRSHFSS